MSEHPNHNPHRLVPVLSTPQYITINMKFFIGAVLASVASAASVDLAKRDSPLDLSLELVGNTAVKAVLTNTGAEALKVLKTGSILDQLEVEKSVVFSGAEKLKFDGVRLWVDYDLLSEENFQIIEAGETVEVEFDVAVDHDLSSGGDFSISSVGAFPYAEVDSTKIAGTASFSSNVLSAHVDGQAAAKVRRDWHAELEKRSAVQSDCTGTRRTAIVNALSNCRSLATAAATAASSGPAARLTEFFKSSTASTRSTVQGVFNRIATECGSSTSGNARIHCTDIYPACGGGTVAYAVPAQNYQVYCPIWFSNYAASSSSCRGTSQAGVLLHEMTHLRQVRGTDDFNCYGYTCLRSLSASQNINHADTYMYFSQAVRANC
ncbi:metalloproteinase [Paramyrothecium foliicola]|nr:metalloproteinase [Paramyrothecium foliicola]